MNVYLGLADSELLITELNRDIDFINIEVKETVEAEDGTLHEYIVGKKKGFKFVYDKILDDDLNIILTEFNRQTTLSLKIEDGPDSGNYDSYIVLFQKEPVYKLWKELTIEGTKHFIYENCNFTLVEKGI